MYIGLLTGLFKKSLFPVENNWNQTRVPHQCHSIKSLIDGNSTLLLEDHVEQEQDHNCPKRSCQDGAKPTSAKRKIGQA